MFDLAVVLIALGLLMYLAYRGFSLLVLAPAMALAAAGVTGGLPILAAYTKIFMTNTGSFIISFFPLFMLGAIFGKLMDDTGSARSMAQSISTWLGPERAILSVVLCCAALTYGGVSAFVVVFAMLPIAAALFRTADIPRRLIPGAIALGAFTFTMSALPGSPAIQNAIPMPFFGTTSFAAPGLGIVASAIMLGGGLWWLERRARAARRAGERYGKHDERVPEPDVALREHAQQEGFDINELTPPATTAPVTAGSENLPPFALAALPVLVVIVTNFAFVQFVVPRMDTSFLADPLFGETTIEAVRGLWAVILGLFLASLLLIVANWKRLTDVRASIDHGADASVLPIFNTASLVGFGAVIAALPVFGLIRDAVLGISDNPLIAVTGSVTILSAMTGSASGGMSIALEALGPTFVDMAQQAGVSLDAMHRVTAMASGTLDVMPHSGAVITLLAVCGLTHRESYADVFLVASAVPIVAMLVSLVLVSVFGTF